MCADYGTLSGTKVNVTAVCGDQNAALFGAGEISADTALINLGSGAFILRPMQENTSSEKQLTGISCSDDNTVSYLREATINGAGSALGWVAEQYDIHDIKQRLPEWIKTVENPPLFINAIGGLGSPWWRQDVKVEFIGHDDLNYIDINNKAALVVAVIESIVFMLRANLDLMMKESPLKTLRVTGGLSNVDGLCQKLANLCKLPVERTENPEATARGVAWLAAGRPAHWNSPGASPATTDIFRPIPDKALEQRYSQYVEMLEKN
jgi:glycerol kinase